MADLFDIVHPDNEATVLVALNGLTDNPNAPEGFATLDDDIDLGSAEPDLSLIGQDDPDVADVSWAPVNMTIPVWAKSTSFDNLRAMVEELHRLIAAGGYVLRWWPEGSAEPRFADLLPSPIAGLIRGEEEGALRVLGQFQDPGHPLTLTRRPFWRGPVIAGVETVIDNGPNRGVIVDNPGTAPSLAHITVEPNGGRVVQVKVGERSQGDLTAYDDIAWWAATAMATRVATAQVADGDAYGGQAMRVQTGDDQGLQRRLRIVRTPSAASATRGAFRLFGAVKISGTGRYRLQARYAAGDRSPVEVSLPDFMFDGSDLEDFHYVMVPFGDVWLPDGGPVTIEIWSDEVESTGDLYFSDFALVPIDERFADFHVPGFWRAGTSPTTWRGDRLRVVAGGGDVVKKNDTARLNAVGASVGSPGGAQGREAGRHRVTAKVTIRNLNENTDVLGYLRVYSGGGAVLKQQKIKGRKDRSVTTKIVELAYDDAGGATVADYRVEMTAKPGGSQGRITVHWIRDRFQRYAGAGSAFVIDGKKRSAYLRAAGTEVSRLAPARGGFPVIAPGRGLLFFHLGDDPDQGYSDVIDQAALAKHVPGRAADVTIDLIPRYY